MAPSKEQMRWREPETIPPAEYLAESSEILRRVAWQRGYRTAEAAHTYLHPRSFRMPDLAAYPALIAAAERVTQAIAAGEPIVVWGDFDADGQTATALLVGALRRMGARVSYYIPNRMIDAHGLHAAGIDTLAASGCRLLVTCDCGTGDVAPIEHARGLGVDVIVTDHHQQLGPLPDAVAVVNSSHLPPDDPLFALPGVAMAYVLARTVFLCQDRSAEANGYLDLVALGIIADMAPHTPACRALLARGLPLLWRSPRPGVQALLEVANIHPGSLDTDSISFTLAPLLNAAGRLADASVGVDLLLAPDDVTARSLARRLQDLNSERKRRAAELDMEIDALLVDGVFDDPALVIDGLDWHPGLIGLAANRLARRHGRPAVIISRPHDGGPARGSARSAGSYDVLEAIAQQSHLLLGSGGHVGAAGLTIAPEHIAAFRAGFVAAIASQRARDPGPVLAIDAVVPWHQIDTSDRSEGSLIHSLMQLAPFGQGNPLPVLASKALRLVSLRPFGAGGRHAWPVLADEHGYRRELTWWNYDPMWQPDGLIDVAYTLIRDEWQGRERIRLTLQGIRPHREGQ